MRFQVGQPSSQEREILLGVHGIERSTGHDFGAASMGLEGSDGGDEHHCVRFETRHATLDIEELLHPHIGAEPRFCDDVLAELKRNPVGKDRTVAVGDIGEGTRVDERQLAFESLHDGGVQGVLHEHGHSSGNPEVFERDGRARFGRADHHPTDPFTEITERRRVALAVRQRQDGHEFRGDRDVVSGLPGPTVQAPAQAYHDVPKGPIVHIHDPPPQDSIWVDGQSFQALICQLLVGEPTLVVPPSVDGGRHEIVSCRDGMDIAGEVEIEFLHGNDLGVPAPGRSTLDPEGRTHGRLPDGGNGLLAEHTEPLHQPNGGGGLAFAERGRGDRGDIDVLAGAPAADSLEDVEIDLGGSRPVGNQLLSLDSVPSGHVGNGLRRGGLGDLEVTGNAHVLPSLCGALETTESGPLEGHPRGPSPGCCAGCRYSSSDPRLSSMFGPLNGVRSALVIAAFLTAIVAAILGFWVAAAVLLAAVAVHGLGWFYLWKKAEDRLPSPE